VPSVKDSLLKTIWKEPEPCSKHSMHTSEHTSRHISPIRTPRRSSSHTKKKKKKRNVDSEFPPITPIQNLSLVEKNERILEKDDDE